MNKTFKSFRNAVGSVLLVLAFGLFQCPAFAQLSRTITGIVSDQNGDPVIGAGILIQGTNSGTTTASNGSFELPLMMSGDVVLTVSSLGFREKTVIVPAAQSQVDIVVEEDMTQLNDVVVVAYGTQRELLLQAPYHL